jgi:hypothetical protein
MRAFACPTCDNRVHFDSMSCVACDTALQFEPASLAFRSHTELDAACSNRDTCNCNWEAAMRGGLCLSCGRNQTIPPIDDPLQQRRWVEVEGAKRRLVYDLLRLGLAPLPIASLDAPLTFDILVAAEHGGSGKVIMGHDSGHITIDATEADAHLREERRERLGEAYRTMLGHMRHEAGHYFWDRLFELPGFADTFRTLFGDERADYGEALKAYYASATGTQWQEAFISEYSTAHPWEDWAETFAHYLHMRDGLETMESAALGSFGWGEPAASSDLEDDLRRWVELSIFMNSMNRGLGHRDFYPFVISPPVRDKLAFIDNWLARLAEAQLTPATT